MKKLGRIRIVNWIVIFGGLTSLGLSEVKVQKGSQGELHYELERKSVLTDQSKKELQSGLNTQILLLAKLEDASGHEVSEQVKKISVRYDLWDEKYQLEISPDAAKLSFSTLPEAVAWIEAPGPFSWMPVASLKPGSYRLSVLETLNPVSQDRLEDLQKWITQQRLVTRVGSPDGSSGEVTPGGETAFTALFHGLWKRAAEGQMAGEVQREALSEPFDPRSLPTAAAAGGKR